MKSSCRTNTIARSVGLLAAVMASITATGCNPYSTAVKLGVKLVGEGVNDADVAQKSQQLMGQPVSAADAAFGQRIRTLQELQTGRQLITYPVKDDLLKMFRWAVEAQNGAIVALSKLQNDPDGGKDIAEKLVLKEIVDGKTPQQIQSHKYFQNLILTLRDTSTGYLIRVYDVSNITDFMGGRYCVLGFDAADRCKDIWLVGVPASTSGSALGH
jgi:hypothetical protein